MKALTLTFALLLICTGAALAQTPDGETPAQETVCDSENGAAFGLCNAYCEAMDCDSESPQASETACTKVRDKFMNIAGHDLPCEAPPTCPCVDAIADFGGLLGLPGNCFGSNTEIIKQTPFGTIFAGDSPTPDCGVQNGGSLAITLEEAAVCVQLISQSCG